MQITGYTVDDQALVTAFIRKAKADAVPDLEILNRAVLIKDDSDIVGMVSYESHGNMGVIRYFLYDARVAGNIDLIAGMYFELYKNAHADGIKQLIAQVPSAVVGELFATFGFVTVEDGVMRIELSQ